MTRAVRPRPELPAHTFAVVAFDRISAFHLSVPCLVFGEDRRDAGVPPLRVDVCSLESSPLRTSAGFHIDVPHGLARLGSAATILVPSWRDVHERPPEPLLQALRRAHARGARIVGLCLGAFVLAEAGLLDGRTATTHWHWADVFAQRFPRVRLDREVLYVQDGPIVTSAGTAASLDCCLHLLRQDFGAEVAARVARRLVVAPHRRGGQAQFIEQPLQADAEADRLSSVLGWVSANLQREHTLDALAKRAGMSRRTFTRRFRQITGTSVNPWLAHQRVTQAQRMLETSDASIEQIALQTGFGSALSLRQHFTRELRTSPSEYRSNFRG